MAFTILVGFRVAFSVVHFDIMYHVLYVQSTILQTSWYIHIYFATVFISHSLLHRLPFSEAFILALKCKDSLIHFDN